MKNLLLLLVFLTAVVTQAQARPEQNPFAESDAAVAVDQSGSAEDGSPGVPPPDGDDPPAPIDDYIPLLVTIAAGLITYKTYGRKSLS